MASSKDTFESGTFLASTFACGTWRGIGVDVASPTQPGIEFTLPENRMHHTMPENRMQHTLPSEG